MNLSLDAQALLQNLSDAAASVGTLALAIYDELTPSARRAVRDAILEVRAIKQQSISGINDGSGERGYALTTVARAWAESLVGEVEINYPIRVPAAAVYETRAVARAHEGPHPHKHKAERPQRITRGGGVPCLKG